MRHTLLFRLGSVIVVSVLVTIVSPCAAQVSIGGPNGVNIGGGRGLRIGGPFGVHIGGGRGASFGGPYGAQFGGAEGGARFGGPYGVRFGGATPDDESQQVDGVVIGDGEPFDPTQPQLERPTPTFAPPPIANRTFTTLTYPREARRELQVTLNDQPVTLQPGKTIELPGESQWIVRFDRGTRRGGELSYRLPPGNYQFRQKPSGWDLFLLPASQSPTEQLLAPTPAPRER